MTNNVLFMFSSLYEINPNYYEKFINGLTDSYQYEVIPMFRQQIGNPGGGIIDGHIELKASKIIIETKLHGLEVVDKLLKYTYSFDPNEYRLLFHLSSKRYDTREIENIKNKLNELNEIGKVNFFSLSYQDLVDDLNALVIEYQYDYKLQRLSKNFENYCTDMKLMPKSNHVLRAMACGQSIELNKKHKFYFDSASRGYSDFNYLGIYKEKSVQYIGIVENMIEADWDKTKGLIVKNSTDPPTEEQKTRLIGSIKECIAEGWNIGLNHRFFLFKDLIPTNFKKESPGGIFRVRYFNLEDYLDKVPDDIETIADDLKSETWK